MKAKTKTLKIKTRSHGQFNVKIDSEDEHLFSENSVYIADIGSAKGPMVRFNPDTADQVGFKPYASRVILEKHNNLDFSKNVLYKNGDHFDLRKSNLIQR